MTSLKSSLGRLTFVKPNPLKHAPITLSWFESESGHETLLLMGNAAHEIQSPLLQTQIQILEEFISLEENGQQITRMINFDEDIVGVAWIELAENHNVKPPSVHLMIGSKEHRGKGIGKASMQALIGYIKDTIPTEFIYSRHLKSNIIVANMNRGLGFEDDGEPYFDDNGLEWQNIVLLVAL